MTLYFLLIISLYVNVQDVYCQAQGEIPWSTLMDSPWPMIKHDPQATGRSPYEGPKTPNLIWTRDLEFGVFSGPAIDVDGNLYVGTNTWLQQDTTNYFYSIYPDGTIRWTFKTGETLATDSGFLISSDSTIYFASQGGFVYAVDYGGNLKWKQDYGMNIFSHVMNIDLDSSIYFTSADGNLYSVYKHNGDIRWKVSYQGGVFSGFAASSPTFSPDGQTIYIVHKDSNLYALNLDSTLKWEFIFRPAKQVPLVDNAGNIYIIGSHDSVGLHSINPEGVLRWSYNFTSTWGSGGSTPFLSATIDQNGNLFFIAPIQGSTKLISVDYNGNLRWGYNFEQGEFISVPLICDSDGTIYCGSTFGYYYYAISNQGELLWKLPLNGYQVDNSGAISSDGTLFIGTHLGSLVTGQEKTLIAIRDTVTSVDEYNLQITEFILEQNYPNPFNPSTKIDYSIAENSFVSLKVYDILGNEVAELVNEYKSLGEYQIEFNAAELPSGIYLYTLVSGNYISTKKLILLK
ncbi:MAG TPA: PQQ-binding-like beta-propeller repeat protein [Ignavibacteriaceae bacterium]|nr:PQQ-binding-like beta-propeller repeat protein [Ignavibacteriaceae bacterium]